MISIPESNDDFLSIAIIHKNELLDGGFVSECSVNFIKLFYEKINKYGSSVLLIDKNENEKVAGFIFCSVYHNEFYKKFLRENIFVIFKFRNLFLSLIKTVFRKMFSSHFQEYKSELVNIAVDSNFQGTGVGKKLIEDAEKKLSSKNVSVYFLQVFEDNASAVKLYKNIGFETVDSLAIKGRKKLLMKRKI
jgi:ribosomal protein S18 acetylase RimI-like enzyme